MFNGGEGLFETLINKFVMKKIRSIIIYVFLSVNYTWYFKLMGHTTYTVCDNLIQYILIYPKASFGFNYNFLNFCPNLSLDKDFKASPTTGHYLGSKAGGNVLNHEN